MELRVDVTRQALLLDALDVAGPRTEADPIEHVRNRAHIRLRGHRAVALGGERIRKKAEKDGRRSCRRKQLGSA